MPNRVTYSRAAKRQRTEETTDGEQHGAVASTRPTGRKTQTQTPTLPANFNGDLSTLPDFNAKAQELPSSQIANLPATFTNSLLAYAAARDPYISSILTHQHDLQQARQRARVINFTHYAQKAWDLLNVKYARLSSSKAFEKAFDVVSDIGDMFDKILNTVKTGGGIDGCSYGTRKNALNAMIEIMICMATAPNDEIGHQARNDDCVPREMEEKLIDMMGYFDEEELEKLDAEGVTNKVRELIKEADGYHMFEKLDDVVDMLEGNYEEDEEEE